MKPRFIAALCLAGASCVAHAGDQVLSIIADGNSHNFDSVVGNGILFDGFDIIEMGSNLVAGRYNVGVTISGQKLSFDQASSTLNGQTGQAFSFGNLSFFGVEVNGNAPFVLKLAGIADTGASYTGTYTVSAVPEPATYGMLLGGLAVLGFVARRRKARQAM